MLQLKKIENDDETKHTTFSSKSKAETIINEIDFDDIFESIFAMIIWNIYKRFWLDYWFGYISYC